MNAVDQALARLERLGRPERLGRGPSADVTGECWKTPALVLELERRDRKTYDACAERLADRLTVAAGRSHHARQAAVVSPMREDGRTTVTILLARALVRMRTGTRVLILETDALSPSLARRGGLSLADGLEDFLKRSDAAHPRPVWRTDAPGLTVAPLRAPIEDPDLLFRHAFWSDPQRDWRRDYDWILRDHAPIADAFPHPSVNANASDSWLLAGLRGADGALMVRRSGVTPTSVIANLSRRLGDAGVAMLGVVETFADPTITAIAHVRSHAAGENGRV